MKLRGGWFARVAHWSSGVMMGAMLAMGNYWLAAGFTVVFFISEVFEF